MSLSSILRIDEGCKNTLYLDTEGFWTIGIGHKLHSDRDKAISILERQIHRTFTGAISTEEIEMLFRDDLKEVRRSISKNPQLLEVYNSLDPVRKMALENMVFQMGASGVAAFKKSLALMLEKDWRACALELKDSKWFRQTVNRASRVIEIFRSGSIDVYNLK
ncbi:lysozyme [Shewanella phage Thanatos-1]|nr:lysozyme [Shewanella phage Thanatos-1]QLA10610.1 lysozyme [Shewanella phage Thanatos-2]